VDRAVLRLRRWLPLRFTVLLLFLLGPGAAQAPSLGLVVYPDVPVSRDRTIPHYEMTLAADPRDGRHLLGMSITRAGRERGSACRAFASFDGGWTWSTSDLPGQLDRGGIDPQVAFDAEGTAYAVVLGGAATPAANGRRDALLVFRSSDGGRSWSEPVAVGTGETHDAPGLEVDTTGGPFHGRIYISTNYGEETLRNGLLRSADGGRTFAGPVELPGGGEGVLCMNEPLLVLRDGTLLSPLTCIDDVPASYAVTGRRTQRLGVTTSRDGGVTFSPLAWTGVRMEEDQASLWEIHAFRFALDRGSPRFRDRLYAVWGDYREGAPRIWIATSADGGKSWTEGHPVDPQAPNGTRQGMPAIAVDTDGIVGVLWFDTRYASATGYDAVFSASLDGGATFLPPVRVSSASTPYDGAGNSDAVPNSVPGKESTRMFVSIVGNRWPQGGDYIGLAASGGAFHPFWPDGRSGTFQIRSARVEVATTPDPLAAPPADLAEARLEGKVEIVFEPGSYDPATHLATLPVRLRNVSDAPVWGPARLTVKAIRPSAFYYRRTRDLPLEIVGAANGEKGVGATLDFSALLGPLGRLDPGALSGEAHLQLRYAVRDPRPDFDLEVWGRVRPGRKP